MLLQIESVINKTSANFVFNLFIDLNQFCRDILQAET